MTNADTVKQIYEAFGRGDVPFIIGQLAPDVAWDLWQYGNGAQDGGVAYMQERKGAENVTGFFQAVGETLDVSRFEVQGVHDDGDVVIVQFLIDATNRATGKSFVDEEVHIWEFGPDGKVVKFRHVIDTAKHVAASKDTGG
jgi:ketosteroid isomerase-like protein